MRLVDHFNVSGQVGAGWKTADFVITYVLLCTPVASPRVQMLLSLQLDSL